MANVFKSLCFGSKFWARVTDLQSWSSPPVAVVLTATLDCSIVGMLGSQTPRYLNHLSHEDTHTQSGTSAS